jgi:hypothetical protein
VRDAAERGGGWLNGRRAGRDLRREGRGPRRGARRGDGGGGGGIRGGRGRTGGGLGGGGGGGRGGWRFRGERQQPPKTGCRRGPRLPRSPCRCLAGGGRSPVADARDEAARLCALPSFRGAIAEPRAARFPIAIPDARQHSRASAHPGTVQADAAGMDVVGGGEGEEGGGRARAAACGIEDRRGGHLRCGAAK